MKAARIFFTVCVLVMGVLPAFAVPERPSEPTATATTVPARLTTDGIRAEDVMIDSKVISDVWDTTTPADAIGITVTQADIMPNLTGGVTSAQMIEERELLRPPRPKPTVQERLPTKRWRPDVPFQTLFYLGLAVVIVAVLFLKARR